MRIWVCPKNCGGTPMLWQWLVALFSPVKSLKTIGANVRIRVLMAIHGYTQMGSQRLYLSYG